jgi:amino acid adenylation domain-containing protein
MDSDIVHSIFEDTVSRFPEDTAVDEGWRSITYRELNANANCIAHALTSIGVSGQNIVAIYLDASIEYIVAVMGVLKAGAVFMPLNTQFPGKRLIDILSKTQPHILITSAPLENEFSAKVRGLRLSGDPGFMFVLDDARSFNIKSFPGGQHVATGGNFPDGNLSLIAGPDDGCYVITTSGSTGEPKAILGRQKGLSHFIRWEIGEFGLDENVRASLLSPLTFDVSLRDIFVPLTAGGTLCIPDDETRHNPRQLLNWMRLGRITLTHIVPTLFRLLTREIAESENSETMLPDLKYVMIAGEPLFGNDIINWRQVNGTHVELVNLYGPSETTLAKLYYRVKDQTFTPKEMVPIGYPIPNTEVLIVKDGKLCQVDETGEIYIKTAYMTKGYYNAPGLNEVSFVPNPLTKDHEDVVYKTGDQGRFMPDGGVRFEGRLDGQVKLYGNRVEIGEIEVVIRQYPLVWEAAVAARSDSYGNMRLVGYVVPESGNKPAVEALRRFLRERLPEYMVPAVFVTLEELPLTHNGKIDRGVLPEPGRTRPEMEQAYVSPATALEKMLTELWCRVLGLDTVGINDNFFDLGGTSVLAVHLVTLVQQELEIEMPVVKLFQYPNVSLMAKHLSQDQSEQISYENVEDRAQRRRAFFSRQKRSVLRD